jgi:hypothetical protein
LDYAISIVAVNEMPNTYFFTRYSTPMERSDWTWAERL